MLAATILTVYCVLVLAISLAGGRLPEWIQLTHTRMQVMMSLVGGLMLGVGLLHLIPHAIEATDSVDWSVGASLVGLLTMFGLIRVFHVHQHGTLDDDLTHHACEHDHSHEHDHHHGPGVAYSWIGLAIGLSLHTLIDGMALGAAVASESLGDHGGIGLMGIGTFLAVFLHKPLDAMSITTIMHAGKWKPGTIGWINLAFALMCPLGAALFYFGAANLGDSQSLVVGTALAFAGGVFLCISLADILPEVSFHSHDRAKLTIALLLGVLLAAAIGLIEPGHTHGGHEGHDHPHYSRGSE